MSSKECGGLWDGKQSLSVEPSRLDLILHTEVSLPGSEGGVQSLHLDQQDDLYLDITGEPASESMAGRLGHAAPGSGSGGGS